MKGRIIVIDDEQNILLTLQACLEGEGYYVETFKNGESALKRVEEEHFDLALVDMRMPKISGIEILKRIKEHSPETTVVIMTAFGTIETAVEAMRHGAYDYLTKPFSPKQIRLFVEKVFERQSLLNEVKYLRDELEGKFKLENIIGKSKKMQEIFELVKVVAPTEATILIQGESGTGKELIARAIHYKSKRADKPLVIVSCAALSEGLLESELFGHVKGSFTGAIRDKVGRFQLADGGTIFLDEIAEFSPNLQVKLLRVLQEHEFEKVGDSTTHRVDVRVIAATNKDLTKTLENGTFREDLYYRLNVVSIHLPPLRERREDIPLLVEHFLKRYSRKNNKEVSGVSPEVMGAFMEYRWPGNVRELENVIERAVILCTSDTISLDLIPENIRNFQATLVEEALSQNMTLEDLEKEYIKRLLKRIDNKEKVAKILGIDKATLWRKRERYGLK